MKRLWKALICIGMLVLLGYCVYMEVQNKQNRYGVMLMIIAVLVFVYLIYVCRNWLKIYYIMFIMFIGCITANIFLYVPTSYTPLNYEDQNWKIETASEWFLPKQSQELDIQARYYTLFEETVLYNLLLDKEVYIQDLLYSDYRIITVQDLGSRRTYSGISHDGIKRYLQQYNPQVITMESEQSKTKKIYLVTGTVWERPDSIIHILLDAEDNVWMIPDSLLDEEYKEETEFKYQHETDALTFEKVTYTYRYDNVTKKLFDQDGGNSYSNILYLLFLGICGLLFLIPLRGRAESAILIYLAVPIGALLEIVSCIVGYCVLGIRVNIISLVTGMMIPVIIAWGIAYKRKKIQKIKGKPSASTYIAVGIVLTSIICASVWHITFLSPDSIVGISLANRTVQCGTIRPLFAGFSDYSLFMPLLNIGAVLFKVKILYAFVPVLTCSFMGMAWLLLKRRFQNISVALKYTVLFCCFGAVLTVPVFLLNTIWILNNLGIGLYYFGAILLLLGVSQEEHNCYKYLALPLFVFANTARVEGPIFGAIFILLLDEINEDSSKLYSIVLSTVATIIFCINFAFNRSGEVFWSVSKGIIVMLATWFVMAYVLWIKNWKVVNVLVKKINIGIVISCALMSGIILVSVFKSELSLNNIKALSDSLLVNGTHGIIWIIYIFTFLLDHIFKREEMQKIKCIRNVINTYFLTIFALMLFRINPLYSGYNGFKDSANRMTLHVMPMLIVYFVFIMKQLLDEEKKSNLLNKGEV